jgi:MFS family permease
MTKDMEERLPARYWRLWGASAVDAVGDGAFAAAIPLLAARLSHNALMVSAVSALAFLPWLLLSLPIGAVVDRRDRFRLMAQAQVGQAVCVAISTVLIAFGMMSITWLLILVFALGVCEVVFGNASQAAMPSLVPETMLHRANSYQGTVTTIGEQFVGPPIGSLLFAVAVALPFGVNLASFALSAVLIWSLPTVPGHGGQGKPIREAMVTGFKWLVAHREIRTLASLLAVNTFCYSMGIATLVLFATRTLHVSTRGYGLLLAGGAVGSVVSGIVAPRILARFPDLLMLALALAVNVACFVGIGLSPNGVFVAVWLSVNGFATVIWNVVSLTFRQRSVPDELRGRVNSVYKMVGWGLIPVGAIAGGLVADSFGLRTPFILGGIVRAVALACALPVLAGALRRSRAAHV